MDWNIEKHQPSWPEVKERFEAWWNRSSCGHPLMSVIARRDELCESVAKLPPPQNSEQHHLDLDYNVTSYRNFLKSHYLMAEAFPNTNVNIGPDSLEVYLGSEPGFEPDTIWFKPGVKSSCQLSRTMM